MGFNFSDTTYAALLGLFAAVFGIGYPLMIQAMGKIDKKYESARLLDYFEKNSIYLNFNRKLWICVYVILVTPFVLFLSNDLAWLPVVVLASDAIFILMLIIASVGLYKLIHKYYNPQQLYQLLRANLKWREIVDLAIYAAKNEDLALYNACVGDIGKFLSTYGHTTDSEEVKEITESFLRISSRKDAPEFLKSNTLGIDLYFVQPLLQYDLMWSILRRQINNGNFDWIMHYWECADYYYTTLLSQELLDKGERKSFDKEKDRFKEFHVAFCALLLYCEKMEWLTRVMRFTNQLPARYELIPRSFEEIFYWLKHFCHMLSGSMGNLYLENHYRFTEHGGVQTDYITYEGVVRYLACRMLFLGEIGLEVRCKDPLTLPLPCVRDDDKTGEKVIPTNKENINLARQLKNAAKEINEIVKKEGNFVDKVHHAIDSYIEDCKNAMGDSQKDEDNAIGKEKLLKEQLFSEFERQKKILFLDKNPSLDERASEMRTAKCEMKIRESDIYEGDYRYNVNLESVVISRIISDIQTAFNQIFQVNRTLNVYTIRYTDIAEVLDRLQLSDQYEVIGWGVNLEQKFATKTKATIKDALVHYSEIIVLKKSMMPYVVFCTSDNDSGFEQIEGSCLYSNIGELKKAKSSNDKLILKVLVNYKLVVPQSSIEFIRFRVATEVTDKTYDLDKIVPASDVLQ